MQYRLKRIDPYWVRSPFLPVIAAAGIVGGLVLADRMMYGPAVACAAVGAVAVVLAVRPAISAAVGLLALLSALTGYFLSSDPNVADLPARWKLLTAAFSLITYVIVADGLVLLGAVLYNFFAGTAGLSGIALELDAESEA